MSLIKLSLNQNILINIFCRIIFKRIEHLFEDLEIENSKIIRIIRLLNKIYKNFNLIEP